MAKVYLQSLMLIAELSFPGEVMDTIGRHLLDPAIVRVKAEALDLLLEITTMLKKLKNYSNFKQRVLFDFFYPRSYKDCHDFFKIESVRYLDVWSSFMMSGTFKKRMIRTFNEEDLGNFFRLH